MEDREFWRYVSNTDYRDENAPSLEAMVYFVRHFVCLTDNASAWRVIEAIVQRSTRSITKKLYSTVPNKDNVEDLSDELITRLYSEWLSVDAKHEFWEIRFWVCMDKAILDVLRRYRRVRDAENGMPAPTEDFSESDQWAAIPDKSATMPFERAAIRSALANLPEKEAQVIFLYRIEKWSEEKIAELMNVTTRTIRNYLRRAEDHLRALLIGED
ncbi:MAG: sigma-70 family RNA polymerase sigma factor [Chthonomonadales bacterium]